MRKILLATTVFAILSAPAFADSVSVQVQASVDQVCAFDAPPANVAITGTTTGSSGDNTFSFHCNSGTNTLPVTISFQSTSGGLVNANDALTRSYDIEYDGGTPFAASTAVLLPVDQLDDADANAGVTSRTWTATLSENLPVAGAYSDTVAVTLTP